MIEDLAGGLLGGLLSNRLLKFARPRATTEFDSMTMEELNERNRWIEITGTWIFVGGLILLAVCLQSFGNAGPWIWKILFLFNFPIAATLIFVCAVTLPRGMRSFKEFWRFHELKHRSNLYLLLSGYVPSALIGLVAAVAVGWDLLF
jgi:hypothetical protein